MIGSDWQQITWSDFTDKNKQVVEEGEEEEAGGFPFHSVEAASFFSPRFFLLFLNFLEHVQTVGIFGNIFAAWCDVLTFWGYWMGNEKPIFKVIEKEVAISFLFSFSFRICCFKENILTFWNIFSSGWTQRSLVQRLFRSSGSLTSGRSLSLSQSFWRLRKCIRQKTHTRKKIK